MLRSALSESIQAFGNFGNVMWISIDMSASVQKI